MSPWRTAIANRGLARHMIARMRVPDRLREDCEAHCMIALCDAAEVWDPSQARFSTIAAYYLRSAIWRFVTDDAAAEGLTARRARKPSRLRVDLDVAEGEGVAIVADPIASAWLREQIGQLDPHRWQVMTRLLLGHDPAAVARVLGISRQRVLQIERSVVERLRAAAR